jgi:hypothetical protein
MFEGIKLVEEDMEEIVGVKHSNLRGSVLVRILSSNGECMALVEKVIGSAVM